MLKACDACADMGTQTWASYSALYQFGRLAVLGAGCTYRRLPKYTEGCRRPPKATEGRCPLFLPVTMQNANQFSKFFHLRCDKLWPMCRCLMSDMRPEQISAVTDSVPEQWRADCTITTRGQEHLNATCMPTTKLLMMHLHHCEEVKQATALWEV